MKTMKRILAVLLCLVMVIVINPVCSPSTKAMSAFTPRTTVPDTSNACYYNYSCNPFYTSGLWTWCTWYAYGRAYEILGYKPDLSIRAASQWYYDNISKVNNGGGYTYSSNYYAAKLGAVACYENHVQIVEAVNSDGSPKYLSTGGFQTQYGGTPFNNKDGWTQHTNFFYGHDTAKGFLGYIYLGDYSTFANIGEDFYATFLNKASWKPISVKRGTGVTLETEDGTSTQKWRFTRQSDGAYVIRSCYNGKVLEMTDGIRENCVQVTAKNDFSGENYQQWYIIPYGSDNSWIIQNKHYYDEGWVLDLYGADSSDGNIVEIYKRNNSDAQIWSIYSADDVQLSAPIISATVDSPNVTFSCSEANGEKYYDVYIWKNESCDPSDWYKTKSVEQLKCTIALPGGTYYAKALVRDYFSSYYSNLVTFEVLPVTYTITYDANGGQNAPEPQTKLPGEYFLLTVSGNVPTRNGYTFLGWSTSSAATKPEYFKATGQSTLYAEYYNKNEDVTLYAVWEKVDEPATEPTTQPTTKPTEPATKPTEPSTTVPSTEYEPGSGTHGVFEYVTDEKGNAAIIGVKGSISGNLVIPSEIDGHPVTKIKAWAFGNGCDEKVTITIPDTVTEIDEDAFRVIDYFLTGIFVDENNKKYSSDEYGVLFNKDKTELILYPVANERKAYEVPDSVESIADYAFEYSYNLEELSIPSSVTSIEKYAFDRSGGFKRITVNADNEFYSTNEHGVLFNKDKTVLVKYPEGNEREAYDIPYGVQEIGYGAFYNSVNLKNITIPNSVSVIGERAFEDCFFLSEIVIPEGVQIIEFCAFDDCGLTSVSIPSSVTNIGGSAFGGCDSLKVITVDENNTVYSSDEYGVLFNKNKTELILYPIGNERTSYVIPDGVTRIEDYAFCFSANLETVEIPDSVTQIGIYAFAWSDKLTSIVIPEGVTEISDCTFGWCTSLETITIPESVTDVHGMAFEGCGSLTDVYYGGSKSQWDTINIEYSNECLSNADIHFAKEDDIIMPSEPETTVPTTTNRIEEPTTEPVASTTQRVETTVTPSTVAPSTTKPVTEPTTTKPTEPSTTQPVSTTKPVTTKPAPVEDEIIKKPSTSTVKYGETLILHADFTNIPEGTKIEWSVEGDGVTIVPSEDGKTCSVKSTSTGDVTVTAKYTDENGVEHISEQNIESKAGLWQKIVYFVKTIFGIPTVIPNAIKFIF